MIIMQQKNKKGKKIKRVVIYTSPTCPFCELIKSLLNKLGIDYIERDITDDMRAAAEMYLKSGQIGTPVLEINGKIIIGYKIDEVLDALGITYNEEQDK